MTIISPYQRQLVFTRPFPSGAPRAARRSKKVVGRLKGLWNKEINQRSLPTHGIWAVCGIVMAAIFVFGIQAVLISFEKNALSAGLKQARVEREQLELRSAELLSPEALRTYADMVQLSQPSSIHYVSSIGIPVTAQHATARGLAP